MDYTNWNKERLRLKDEILKDLRDQRDRKALVQSVGLIKINPQIYPVNTFSTVGTFTFKNNFKDAPFLDFMQIFENVKKPWLVNLYVESWHAIQGVIDGFVLGLYPLVAAPSGLTQHQIRWFVHGQASSYRTDQNNTWREKRNIDQMTFLRGTDI